MVMIERVLAPIQKKGYDAMRVFLRLPIMVLSFSRHIRLTIIAIAFVICEIVYILVFPSTHFAGIIAIPLVLSAWFFHYRETLFCILLIACTVKLINTFLFHIPFWTISSGLFVLTGLTSMVVIGFTITYLRSTVDLIEMTRRKERAAEQQLERAFQQQQELLQQKDSFLKHVHHELRSPLTVIYGSLQILTNNQDSEQKDFSAFQKMCLQQAMAGCEDLMHLVHQVLEAITTRHPLPVPVPQAMSLVQIAKDLFEHGDPRIACQCQLDLDSSAQVMVWVDQLFLKQILWNIFLNISLYCAPQTIIHLSVIPAEGQSVVAEDVLWWCVRVRDCGPGIPPEEIANLFSPFVRLQRDIAMSIPGSGLGLYISKQLVEAMGGRIWVESSGRQGEGSCFCFTLPNVAS
jgi:signal transduction histidine kinase